MMKYRLLMRLTLVFMPPLFAMGFIADCEHSSHKLGIRIVQDAHSRTSWRRATPICDEQNLNNASDTANTLDPKTAEKFKVFTCSSSSCSKKRKSLNLDEYSTFSALWDLARRSAPEVEVEESPCLGACKMAPCVAIEHEDYEGTVALQGTTESEFSDRVFHNILTEQDAARVWNSLENAILVMSQEEK
jgi:(2Fe-2S) ferredoxin